MPDYMVTYADGTEEKIEASEDLVYDGVILLVGEDFNTIIPLSAFKKIEAIKEKEKEEDTDEPTA